MNASLSSPQSQATRGHLKPSRPGWPEMITGLIAYVVAFGAVYFILKAIPDDLAVTNGIVQLGLSGLMGLFAFAVAVVIRIRGISAFGLKRASGRSLIIAALLAIGCWVLGTIVSLISYVLNGASATSKTTIRRPPRRGECSP